VTVTETEIIRAHGFLIAFFVQDDRGLEHIADLFAPGARIADHGAADGAGYP